MTAVTAMDAYPAVDATDEDRRASRLFVHIALFSCLCLQRFCFFVSGSPIFFCLPVLLALLGWLWLSGRAEVRSLSLALYCAFAMVGLVSALVALNVPDVRLSAISSASFFSILSIYAGLTMRPTTRFDGTHTLDILVFYIRLAAVLGIVQYVIQFAGIKMFAFMTIVPALKPFLIEPFYNYNPVVYYGSEVLRSNGFFLLEPSTFSQMLALGILVEFFFRRDWRFLPLYGMAYVTTYAGTGLLALTIAITLYAIVAPREASRVAGFAGITLILVVIAAFAFPTQFESIAGRADEFRYSGSSGYARYVAQFGALENILGETRTLIGYGPGALERAVFYPQGGGNPILKLFVDYGVLGLIGFGAFFVATLWRRDVALIGLFMLVNFQLGGGNLLFTPLVVLAAIVCIWSQSEDSVYCQTFYRSQS